jgi:hypothetical protein
MRIKINDCDWHRNGVSGEPFYFVDFTMWEDDDEVDLVAVVTERESFVVNPENIFEHFRGDEIGDRLRDLEDLTFD